MLTQNFLPRTPNGIQRMSSYWAAVDVYCWPWLVRRRQKKKVAFKQAKRIRMFQHAIVTPGTYALTQCLRLLSPLFVDDHSSLPRFTFIVSNCWSMCVTFKLRCILGRVVWMMQTSYNSMNKTYKTNTWHTRYSYSPTRVWPLLRKFGNSTK